MKGLLALLLFIALAMLSWGVYGPVLHVGQIGMQGSSLAAVHLRRDWPTF